MQKAKRTIRPNNNSVMNAWWKFFPYWPMFLLLIIVATGGAWYYLRVTVPVYEAAATIILKDENKGVDDAKIMEALNPFSTKKTVENEIEVIKSRALMGEVVRTLNLVAPIFEETKTQTLSAYQTSPVKILVANTDSLIEATKVYFQFDQKANTVFFKSRKYPLDQWVSTPYGTLKFLLEQPRTSNRHGKLYFSLLNPNIVTNDYISRLNVIPTSKLSTVLTLRLKDPSPVRAENILNELVKAYDRAAVREKNSMAVNTLSFVEDRLNIVSKDLDSIEHKIEQYKSQQGATDISNQGRLFLENVSANDQKLSEVNMRLSVLSQVEKYLAGKDKSGSIVPSTLGVEDPLLTDLLNKLYENELEYDKLKKTYAENHPLLLSIQEQINKIKPSILENIQSQRKGLIASRSNLYATNGSYSSMLQTIPQKERELLEISREQAIKTSIYNFLLQKREEAALSHSSASANSRLLDTAQAGVFPVWPNKNIVYAGAVFLAIIIAFIIILIAEMFNRKIISRSDIEALSSIPIVGELLFKKTKKVFAIDTAKHSFLAEQFRKLRTSLPYMGINSKHKKILITSSISGEGKSFTALNLALSLAMAGKKVVLIELDLINPSLSKRLALESETGMTDYLKGDVQAATIIKKTEQSDNLYLIPAGNPCENPSDLIVNGQVDTLLNSLEDQFDVIMIDTAPVGVISDAYFLSPLCDATLFIVRHNYTPKVLIQRFEEEKEVYDLHNVALIYNAVNNKGVNSQYYSYGYDYLQKEEKRITKMKRKYLPQ